MMAASADSERDADGSHPPRSHMVFRVGVTGHRALLGADFPRLSGAVAQILAEVRACTEAIAFRSLGKEPPSGSGNPPRFVIISSLAAGADSLVAEEALKLGYELKAPIPFPRQVYADDFQGGDAEHWEALIARTETVLELNGDRSRPDQAYLAAGRAVLDLSDILIAIWNGNEARGIGGTGQIVEEAVTRNLPVLVIDTPSPHTFHFLNAGSGAAEWRAILNQVVSHLFSPLS